MEPLPIAIIGASGYTGAELVRLLYHHPYATLTALAAERNAGQSMAAIYPHLSPYSLPPLVKVADIAWDKIAIVFCCLPHATSQQVIRDLPGHLKIIDLSADFRLFDTALYAQWYGHPHQAETLQKQAVYGLSEVYRDRIATARLVANPGCYPTCATLPLIPLLAADAIEKDGIIIDAKSGVSGAGRTEKLPNLFCETDPLDKEHIRSLGGCPCWQRQQAACSGRYRNNSR